MKRVFAFLFLALVLGAIGFLILVYANSEASGGARWTGTPNQYELGALVAELHDQGVVEHPELFGLYLRLMGASSRLRDHEVVVPAKTTPFHVLRILAKGYGEKQHRVLVREGLNRFEVAELLQEKRVCSAREFIAATEDADLLRKLGIDASSAEGYLFPDTYALRTPSEPEAVVERLVSNFWRKVGPNIEGVEDVNALLTMASLVEEEAQKPSERATVAGVFQNRLDDPTFTPKRLQADPTVSYGCSIKPTLLSCRAFDGRRITKAMLRDASNPYNTYRHEGLPPGPISNPGLAAIEAARAPEKHEYFFFVAKGDGSHAFAKSLVEHDHNVDKYILGKATP